MAAPRQLGFISAFSLVVASMIGSGVFTTSGFLLGDLGSPGRVLAAWFGGGVLAIFGALCYSALGRRFPESGGEYLFLARTIHPAAGYAAGWVSFLVGFSAPCAAVALALGEYTKDWLPFSTPVLTGSVVLFVFAAVHAFNIRAGAGLQNTAVLLKLALIAGIIVFGISRLESRAAVAPSSFSWGAFMVSLVWVSFSYSGWNAAVYVAGEIRDPDRNLTRALVTGAGVVTVVYLGLNAVFVFAAPIEELAGKLEVARIAAAALGGSGLADFVTAVIVLGLVTSVSSMIMAGPRVYARMAEDGFLPRVFRFPASGAPHFSILLQTFTALVLLWSSTFESLLTYIGFTLSLCTAAAVFGLMRLRVREGKDLWVPGWPWVPGLFVLSVLAIAGFLLVRTPIAFLLGLGTILASLVLYAFTSREKTISPLR